MIEDLNKKIVFSSTFTIFLIVGALIGIASFIYYALGSHADLAWTAFHLNFIFWAGVSPVSYTHLKLPTNDLV